MAAPVSRGTVDEGLGMDVYAQVNHVKPVDLEHQRHHVLADVVQIAQHRPDQHGAARAFTGGGPFADQRPEHLFVHHLRRVCGRHQLGQKDLQPTEPVSDVLHRGRENFTEESQGIQAHIESRSRPCYSRVRIIRKQQLGELGPQFIHVSHGSLAFKENVLDQRLAQIDRAGRILGVAVEVVIVAAVVVEVQDDGLFRQGLALGQIGYQVIKGEWFISLLSETLRLCKATVTFSCRRR